MVIAAEAAETRRAAVQAYLKRRQLYPFQVPSEPSADLGLIVVIPCFDEPDILKPLRSLAACQRPSCGVEVLLVINAPTGAAEGESRKPSNGSTSSWRARCNPIWVPSGATASPKRKRIILGVLSAVSSDTHINSTLLQVEST